VPSPLRAAMAAYGWKGPASAGAGQGGHQPSGYHAGGGGHPRPPAANRDMYHGCGGGGGGGYPDRRYDDVKPNFESAPPEQNRRESARAGAYPSYGGDYDHRYSGSYSPHPSRDRDHRERRDSPSRRDSTHHRDSPTRRDWSPRGGDSRNDNHDRKQTDSNENQDRKQDDRKQSESRSRGGGRRSRSPKPPTKTSPEKTKNSDTRK
jgi:hypothetical protein